MTPLQIIKLVKGKNDTTIFLPLNTKIGGLARYIKDREAICLMSDQGRHIYKMVESESIVNIERTKLKIEADKLDNNNNR